MATTMKRSFCRICHAMAHSWGSTSGEDDKVRDIGAPTSRLIDVAVGFDAVTGQAVQSSIPVAVRRAPQDWPATPSTTAVGGNGHG